jgi:hypothetical protein
MPSRYPAIRSFTAGEISPRMHSRADLPLYHHALHTCHNFNITPQGSAIMRRGWHYIGAASSDVYVRLFTFSRSLGEDIVIEFSELGIRAFSAQGVVIIDLSDNAGTPVLLSHELVKNGNFNSGLVSWDLDVSGEALSDPRPPRVVDGWLNSVGRSVQPLSRYSRITQILMKPDGGIIDDELVISFVTKYDSERFPPLNGVTPSEFVWQVQVYELDGVTLILTVDSQTTEGFHELTPINMALREGVILQVGAQWDILNPDSDFYQAAMFTDISATYTAEFPAPADGVFPWTKEQIPFIQTQMVTGKEQMILVHEEVPPYLITFDPVTGRLRLSLAIFTGLVPPWDDLTGYPSVVEIFQGRLWLGSTTTETSSIWGSHSGNFFEFSLGTGLASEGLYLPLSTRGVIRWLVGQSRTMAVGTDLGEHVINSQGPIITPSDGAVTPVSSYGTSPIQAIPYGNQTVFTTTDVRKLLAFNYEDTIQNWEAMELTWTAEHLTETYILDITSLRAPDYQIVALTQDGNWVQCTFDNVVGVLGWHKHSLGGQVKSITATTSAVGDVLWAAILRDGKMSICRMDASLSRRIHLDYWVRRFPEEDEEGWYVSGLDHLVGLKVTTLLDDNLHTDRIVNEQGIIRLDRGGIEAYVGLAYEATLITLPPEPQNSAEVYSGSQKRNSELTVRLVNSAMPLINGKRPADRSPETIQGTREPNETQDINVRSLGWDGKGQISIVQDKPFRTEIVGIFTKLGTNKT